MEWKELHELENLEEVRDELSPRQEILLGLASSLSLPLYQLLVSDFSITKAEEGLDVIDKISKFAEIIDEKTKDLSDEELRFALNAILAINMGV